MELSKKILDIIRDNTKIGEKIYEINGDENLLAHGMDSFQMMNSIVAIEKKFQFIFSDEDLLTANFSSLNAIVETIKDKLKSENE